MTASTACCEMMAADLGRTCETHERRADCPDALIRVSSEGTFGLYVHDGGSSAIGIAFCPWVRHAPARSRGEPELGLNQPRHTGSTDTFRLQSRSELLELRFVHCLD